MKVTIEASDFGDPTPLDPDVLIAQGWIYCDPPTRFSYEMWGLFCSTIGEDNYKILAMSSGVTGDGFRWKRGQFLINPEGQRRLRYYAQSSKTKNES